MSWTFGKSQEYTFQTRLNADGCAKKLQETLGSGWSFFSKKKFFGKVEGTTFYIYKKGMHIAGSPPTFYGKLNRQNSGTLITSHFYPFNKYMIWMWPMRMLIVLIMLATFVILVPEIEYRLMFIAIALIGLVANTLLYLLSIRSGKRGYKFIIEFIRNTLEAQQTSPIP